MEVFHGNGCFRKLEDEVDIIEGMEKKKKKKEISKQKKWWWLITKKESSEIELDEKALKKKLSMQTIKRRYTLKFDGFFEKKKFFF